MDTKKSTEQKEMDDLIQDTVDRIVKNDPFFQRNSKKENYIVDIVDLQVALKERLPRLDPRVIATIEDLCKGWSRQYIQQYKEKIKGLKMELSEICTCSTESYCWRCRQNDVKKENNKNIEALLSTISTE